jgi:IS4 transposase
MLLTKLLDRFIEKAPITVMAYATIRFALNSSLLDRLFTQTATAQYERTLLFSTVVDLMSLVVCKIHRSVNAAYKACQEHLGVSIPAVYSKLSRMELGITSAFVSHTADRLQPVIQQLHAELPSPIPGYRVRILDGNHLAATERRLTELRGQSPAPLPGQALVVYDPPLDLCTHLIGCEDGHAQERSLLPQVLELVEAREVWIGDRNFCTTDFLFGIARRDAFFLIRQHAQTLHWKLLGKVRSCGRTETGEVFEQRVRLTDGDGNELFCRRITIKLDRPTRDGDWEIHVLTNLPAAVDALTIARAYHRRWTIEVAFYKLATILDSEIDTLAYPKAALFGFAVGVAAYNVLSTVQAALRSVHGRGRVQQDVSMYYLGEELAGVYRGLQIATPEALWEELSMLSPSAFAKWLKGIAKHADLEKYRKQPRGPKKKQKRQKRDKHKPHVSTARLLQGRR